MLTNYSRGTVFVWPDFVIWYSQMPLLTWNASDFVTDFLKSGDMHGVEWSEVVR